MTTITFAFAAFLAGSVPPTHPAALVPQSVESREPQESTEGGQPRMSDTAAEFDRRVRAYMAVHRAAAAEGPPIRVTTNTGEVRQSVDALALLIRLRRPGAQQGDIFTPAIATLVRDAIRKGCDGNFIALLALAIEELEAPLPAPVVYGRWLEGAPLPTMPVDLLAELPRLPAGLEYRFVNRDLVLLDVDADLIVDFVSDAIPAITAS